MANDFTTHLGTLDAFIELRERVRDLEWQLAQATAALAALSKPVTDEEWASADFDSEDGEFYMQRYRIDALIASRAAPDAGKRRSDVSQD